MQRTLSSPIALLTLLAITGCAVGPDYVRPTVTTPQNFKEAEGQWIQVGDVEPTVPTEWWKVFKDDTLDALEAQVNINNQNILIAAAQYRVARATVDTANAAYFPKVTGNFGATRAANALVNNNNGTQSQGAAAPNNTVTLSASTSWEVDLWGELRRASESANASYAASAGDLAAAQLSAQALLAQTYFQLRSTDVQLDLQNRTVEAYTRYLQITKNRVATGVASDLDVNNAESQLATAKATVSTLTLQRDQYEHALAVIVGKTPSEFSLPPGKLPDQPVTPQLVPSRWLITRPDIVAAERRVAAANAQIGVAKAAWFPTLTLSASGGYRGSSMDNLLTLPHRFWSLGPSLAETIFDGGARSAAIASATASYDQSVATYRQTVLAAFQEVEDNLAAIRLGDEAQQQRVLAAKAANRARDIALNQYQVGVADQLAVITAQASALAADSTLITTRQNLLLAAVLLYKNTGKIGDIPVPGNEQIKPPEMPPTASTR